MKRRSKSEWQTLFLEQEASGLSVVAFCRERGLNPQYFGKRRRQLQDGHPLKPTSSFLSVALRDLINIKLPTLKDDFG